MKKLADISAFESLQGQHNNIVSDMAVFNGVFTNEIVGTLKKMWGSDFEDMDFLAEQVGTMIGVRAKNMETLRYKPKIPSEFSNPNFIDCTEEEKQKFLLRECEDAANAIKAFMGRKVFKWRIFSFALSTATGGKYGTDFDAWKIHRDDDSDPAAEYGG